MQADARTSAGYPGAEVSHLGLVLDEKYRIESKLGSGGMATVYCATRLLIGDSVAIKILHPEQVRDPQSAERFRREAQAAARLKHPNAVTVYDFGVSADGLIYLVMELVAGKSIRAMIEEQGPLTPTTAAEILKQACAALQEAHNQNIVHRDVKPDNIVVDVTPAGLRVKVLDFGIARMRDVAAANLTQTGSVMGTPYYMSPEQCLGEELDNRSDVYSLGVVLFEMLAGIVPFNSPTPSAVIIQHVNQAPPPLRVINISIPQAIEAVVIHALAKRREDRPQSAAALAEELGKALGARAAVGEELAVGSKDSRGGFAATLKMNAPDWSNRAVQVGSGAVPSVPPASKSPRSRFLIGAGVLAASAVVGVLLYPRTKTAETQPLTAPVAVVGQLEKRAATPPVDSQLPVNANPTVTRAPETRASSNSTPARSGEAEPRKSSANERRASYLNVRTLPSKVEFVVSAATSGRTPMNMFAAAVARNLKGRGKTASDAVFSPEFVTTGGFESFFSGRAAADLREMPLAAMADKIFLASVAVSTAATEGTSVTGLTTATARVSVSVISTIDGSAVDSFELTSVAAGASEASATSSVLDRIIVQLGQRGY